MRAEAPTRSTDATRENASDALNPPEEGVRFPLKVEGHDGLGLRVWWDEPSGFTIAACNGEAEAVPVYVPLKTSRGTPGLLSVPYQRQVLQGFAEVVSLSDKDRGAVERRARRFLAELHQERLQEQRAELAVEASSEAPELTEAERGAALGLLRVEDFLINVIAPALRRVGLVGERNNALLLWLITLTRFMAKTVSVILKADPSTGKNWLVDRVLEIVPPEDVIHFDRVTTNALFYAEAEVDLRHKILVIEEMAGAEDALYSLRTLEEKGELKILVTVTKKGSAPEARKIRVRGPCVVITTTTKSFVGEDQETRTFSLALDASPEQTREIIRAEARLFNSATLLPEEDKERFRNIQRLVHEALAEGENPLLGRPAREQVAAPFLEALAELFPVHQVRVRRDFKRIDRLVAAHALLKAPLHPHRDGRGRIVADVWEDYEAVFGIAAEVFEQSAMNLPPLSREVLEAARAIIDSKTEKYPTVKRGEIAAHLGWSEGRARRWIFALEGLYLHVEKGGQGQAYVYTVRDAPKSVRLPAVGDVARKWSGMLEAMEAGQGDSEMDPRDPPSLDFVGGGDEA